MGHRNYQFKYKKYISTVMNAVIVLCFLLLCLLYLTNGFVYEFFGIKITILNYKDLLLIISILWILKKIVFAASASEVKQFFKVVFFFIVTLSVVLLSNFFIYGYYQSNLLKHDFESYKNLPHTSLNLTEQTKDWNVVLISIDTLRADHLGAYGYERNTSSHIDDLAAQGVLFMEHIAPASSTLPSHASMFTSLNPFAHKAELSNTNIPLDRKLTTLTEVLKNENFATVAFTGGSQLASEYGLGQGFDIYNDEGGGIEKVLDKTLSWLRKNKDQRFFLFFHTYETHHPYTPPEPYNSLFYPEYNGKLGKNISIETLFDINEGRLKIDKNDINHIISIYDGEIAYMDEKLNLLFNELKVLGLWDKTLIVFTSDH